MPTAAEIASQRVRMPTPAEIAAQRTHMPTDAELARQPAVVMPRLDALPTPAQPGIDAGAMAAQYEAIRKNADPQAERAVAGLLVFVTLQMPRASLERIVEQADRSRATLVLRGLKDRSMKGTLLEVASILGKHKVAWMIDPVAFKRYEVTLAPTFVLVAPDGDAPASCASGQCGTTAAYSKVVGDVSTTYALQTIQRADPAFRSQALAYLGRLERKR